MEQTKIFNVVLVKPGVDKEYESVQEVKTIRYSGKQKKIGFN